MQTSNLEEKKRENKTLPAIIDTADAGEERVCGEYAERGQPTAPANTNSSRRNSQDWRRSLRCLCFSSSADIKSGYWQVKMELEVREMAAFICCLGPLQFKVIYQESSKQPAKGRLGGGWSRSALETRSRLSTCEATTDGLKSGQSRLSGRERWSQQTSYGLGNPVSPLQESRKRW